MNQDKAQFTSEQHSVDAVRASVETFDDWFFKEPYRAKYRSVYNKSDPVYMSAKEAWDYQGGLAARNEWISVKDRLPECNMKPNSFGVRVLIYPPRQMEGCSDEPCVFYGCRQTDEPNFYLHGAVIYKDDVTHWMPLPPIPSVKE